MTLSDGGVNYSTGANIQQCGIVRTAEPSTGYLNFVAMPLTSTIHAALLARGVSIRKVHLATGLDRATVKRFIETGKASCDSLDLIADYLGATIAIPSAPKASKKATKKRRKQIFDRLAEDDLPRFSGSDEAQHGDN